MLTRFLPPGVCHSAGWCTFLRACSAWPCHLQKGQQSRKFPNSILLLQADIISLHTLRLSICLPQGLDFREFLFTKLINAEYACYKAEKFAKLEVRRVLWCTLRYRSMNACSVFVCVCVCVCTLEYAPVRKGVHPAACALDSEWYQRRLYHNPQEL